MRRLTRFGTGLAAALCVAAFLFLSFAGTQAATPVAGLLVIHEDGETAWVLVPFVGESISGVDLIHRSGLDITEVSFGGLGVGICAIDETGCDVSECRRRLCHGPDPDDPYWQYFLGNPDGTWTSSALGISADTVLPGDVRAFTWSASEPLIPAPTIGEVALKTGSADSTEVQLARFGADGTVLLPGDLDGETSTLATGALVLGFAVFFAGSAILRTRVRRRT